MSHLILGLLIPIVHLMSSLCKGGPSGWKSLRVARKPVRLQLAGQQFASVLVNMNVS